VGKATARGRRIINGGRADITKVLVDTSHGNEKTRRRNRRDPVWLPMLCGLARLDGGRNVSGRLAEILFDLDGESSQKVPRDFSMRLSDSNFIIARKTAAFALSSGTLNLPSLVSLVSALSAAVIKVPLRGHSPPRRARAEGEGEMRP
jgi:hypothetical protein